MLTSTSGSVPARTSAPRRASSSRRSSLGPEFLNRSLAGLNLLGLGRRLQPGRQRPLSAPRPSCTQQARTPTRVRTGRGPPRRDGLLEASPDRLPRRPPSGSPSRAKPPVVEGDAALGQTQPASEPFVHHHQPRQTPGPARPATTTTAAPDGTRTSPAPAPTRNTTSRAVPVRLS